MILDLRQKTFKLQKKVSSYFQMLIAQFMVKLVLDVLKKKM